jgi:thymidylate synthase
MKYTHEDGTPFTKEGFLEKLETDTEFNKEFGNKGIDQISELIKQLKENPDSRRLIVNAWAVHDLPHQVLPPCHYGFQVYTRELDETERVILMDKKLGITENLPQYYTEDEMVKYNIPKRAISLNWSQRSCDFPLGIPMNIASYALLLMIIAKEVNMVPYELIGNFGDCHIYKNQVDGVKEQISREPFTTLPSVEITERNWYQHQLVKEHLGEKTFSEKILSYRPDCFVLKDYISHPKIYFPLSN